MSTYYLVEYTDKELGCLVQVQGNDPDQTWEEFIEQNIPPGVEYKQVPVPEYLREPEIVFRNIKNV